MDRFNEMLEDEVSTKFNVISHFSVCAYAVNQLEWKFSEKLGKPETFIWKYEKNSKVVEINLREIF